MESTDETAPPAEVPSMDAGLGSADPTTEELEAALGAAPEEEPEEAVPFAAFCQPLFDKVIVQMDAPKTREGSLHIPDAHQELPHAATVLAVGTGRLMEGGLAPMYVRPTDRVLFGKYAGIDIPEDYGKRIKVLSQDEILWIFPRPHPATTGDAWPTKRATAGDNDDGSGGDGAKAPDAGEVTLDKSPAA